MQQPKATPPPPPPRRVKPPAGHESADGNGSPMPGEHDAPAKQENSFKGNQTIKADTSTQHGNASPDSSSRRRAEGSPMPRKSSGSSSQLESCDSPQSLKPAQCVLDEESGTSNRRADPGDIQDMHGFLLKGSDEYLSSYAGWQKGYCKKQTERGARWSDLIKRSPVAYEKSSTLKKLVRKGIPNYLRGRVWMEVTGAAQLLAAHPGLYQGHLDKAGEQAKADALSQIELDLHRTFPDHPRFNHKKAPPGSPSLGSPVSGAGPGRGGAGGAGGEERPGETLYVQALRRVLRAYAVRNAEVGYCQGMNFIAGVMLLFLEEESVFWLLAALIENILPPDYYAHDLIGCSVDLRVFNELLAQKFPKVSKKLAASGVGMEFFSLEWFISLFSKALPSETVLRIWDCVFFEGDKIVFRVALGVVGLSEAELLAAADQTDLFQAVQEMGRGLLDADALLKAAFAFQLKREAVHAMRGRLRVDIERERRERALRSAANRSSD